MDCSTLALEAADDFDRLCSVLGTFSLNREQFVEILRGLDLPKDESTYAELFDQLCVMCKEAEAICFQGRSTFSPSKALQVDQLDSDAIRCLYANHPSYTTCGNPMKTSHALTDYIKGIFEISMSRASPKPRLDRCELATFLRNLSNEGDHLPVATLSEEKKGEDDADNSSRQQAIGKIDDNRKLDLEQVASFILRYESPSTRCEKNNIDPKKLFGGKLPAKLFDPFQTNPEDFVAAIDAVVLDHDALKHHVLTSLSMGSWGGLAGTLRHLSDFMLAYRQFTSTFVTHLEATIKMIGDVDCTGDHVNTLKENMEEEQGMNALHL